MAGGIFISYRRDDAKHAAGRLVDRLSRTIPSDQLFLDIDNIEPGLDFKKVLSEKVAACNVLLAVIGPGWLASSDERGARRLDNPRDFVRIEIEAALARDVRVIPVLVDGARMPGEEELPETLRPLAYRNAVRLTHERFASDAEDLTKALAKVIAPARAGGFPQKPGPPKLVQPTAPIGGFSAMRSGFAKSYVVMATSFLVALLCAFLGFGGVAGTAVEGARLLFWLAVLVLSGAVIFHLFKRLTRR